MKGVVSMSSFDERKKAFEDKFAYDSEIKFKVEARRNKLLALWASELLEKNENETKDYIKDVIKADFQEAGDGDVFRKLSADLKEVSTEMEVRNKMDTFFIQAKDEIMSET